MECQDCPQACARADTQGKEYIPFSNKSADSSGLWGWFSVAVGAKWRELFWTTYTLYIFVLFIN